MPKRWKYSNKLNNSVVSDEMRKICWPAQHFDSQMRSKKPFQFPAQLKISIQHNEMVYNLHTLRSNWIMYSKYEK